MTNFETLYNDVIKKALVEKFTKLIADNGEIAEVNEWGKRKLAYPINDKNEGYYVLVNFKSEGTLPSEKEFSASQKVSCVPS